MALVWGRRDMIGDSQHDPGLRRYPESEARPPVPPIPGRPSWQAVLGFLLIIVQLGAVLAAHVSDCCESRYFVWAPNDYSIDYTITARVNGRNLSAEEIRGRYRLPKTGFYEDPPHRLLDYLRRCELEAYGGKDSTDLAVEYKLNGRPPVIWRWSSAP
jgi:hypothetical protein